jgi:hypothetical protein
MRNLQGCEDIQETDVIGWVATDDRTYCNTDLYDNGVTLVVTRNVANELEDTENSDTVEAFQKSHILKVKKHFKWLFVI